MDRPEFAVFRWPSERPGEQQSGYLQDVSEYLQDVSGYMQDASPYLQNASSYLHTASSYLDQGAPALEDSSSGSDSASELACSESESESDADLPVKPAFRHINDLPEEVLCLVRDHLDSAADLIAFMRVQRSWFALGARRFWCKPQLTSRHRLQHMVTVLPSVAAGPPSGDDTPAIALSKEIDERLSRNCDSVDNDTLDEFAFAGEFAFTGGPMGPPPDVSANYASLVRRLNLSHVARSLDGEQLLAFAACRNIDRLVLQGCERVPALAIAQLLAMLPNLLSVDLQLMPQVDDLVVRSLVATASDLQVFYGGGIAVSNEGLACLRRVAPTLRRLRLSYCPLVDLDTVLSLALECPQLIEFDLSGLDLGARDQFATPPGISPESLAALCRRCPNLRELRLDRLVAVDPGGADLSALTSIRMDSLRVLTLSMCPLLTDAGVELLVRAAPRLRHLNLSKCPLLTDCSLAAIADAYGSGLHYIHLGHCTKITDAGVARLAAQCTRLSYFDAANCSHLTDHTLVLLAKLPRLRRIGVVKCGEIGSLGVLALAHAGSHAGSLPLERLHLSYCSTIDIAAVRELLRACPRLVHLSLTGVRAFMRSDIMRLSRPPPPELNVGQRQLFCVFSGSAVNDLRLYLESRPDDGDDWEPGDFSAMMADMSNPRPLATPVLPPRGLGAVTNLAENFAMHRALRRQRWATVSPLAVEPSESPETSRAESPMGPVTGPPPVGAPEARTFLSDLAGRLQRLATDESDADPRLTFLNDFVDRLGRTGERPANPADPAGDEPDSRQGSASPAPDDPLPLTELTELLRLLRSDPVRNDDQALRDDPAPDPQTDAGPRPGRPRRWRFSRL